MSRRWFASSGVIVVAIASIATPRPRWSVQAQVPANDEPRLSRVVEVEASHEPEMTTHHATTSWVRMGVREKATAKWPGKGTFFVPAGSRVQDVRIGQFCNGGPCCKCPEPEGAYVRITGIHAVESWKLEARGAPQQIQISTREYATTRVTVTSTGTPRLAGENRAISSVQTYDGGFNVSWNRPATGVVEWTPIVTLEGPCPDAKPCDPPADARVTIENVKTEWMQR